MDEETLFHQALQRPAAERDAYLEDACGGDAVLQQRVRALVHAAENPGGFMGRPAADLEAATGPQVPGPGDPAPRPTVIPEGPGTRVGPYKLLQQIGEGGMGVVFMAEQSHPMRRTVALKIIKPGMDSRQVIARFEAERQALALMDHPNVAKVLDAGTTPMGLPYFVMELVKGVPITRYCDEQRLTPRARLELFLMVCQAVQHAHQKGVIHRDLKPSNVLVAHFDEKPVPKVIDFGVAKAAGATLTERTIFTGFGSVVGTLEYMSPEQARLNQLDVDTRSDIYALGVLLYELLTGSTPLTKQRFEGAALQEALRIIREEDPPKPSTRLSTAEQLPRIAASRGLDPARLPGLLRRELDWIVMKALEKDRNRRYETASGLAADVRRYLNHEPIRARPPSTLYRLVKGVRRHKVAMAAGAAVVAALVIGLGVATYALIRARSDRDHAVAATHAEARQRQAAEDAQQRTAEANRFLRDLIRVVQGGDLDSPSLRGTNEVVAKLNDGRFRDKPEVQSLLHGVVGTSYLRLASYADAERHLKIALSTARQAFGEGHVEVGNIHFHLGRCAHEQKEYLDAEPHYRQALGIFRKASGETDPRVFKTLWRLSEVVESGSGDAPAAAALRRESLVALVALHDKELTASPADGRRFHMRGAVQFRLGRFREAQEDFTAAVELAPQEHRHWYSTACLRLYLGDEAGYREACRGILERFGNAGGPPEVTERTLKVCSLAPGFEREVRDLSAPVDRVIATNSPSWLVPRCNLSKGLAEYRAGNDHAALDRLARVVDLPGVSSRVELDLVTAMACRRLGRTGDAGEALRRAINRIETRMAHPGNDVLGPDTEDWLTCQILRREADALTGLQERHGKEQSPP